MSLGSHHKGHPLLLVGSGPSEQYFFVQVEARRAGGGEQHRLLQAPGHGGTSPGTTPPAPRGETSPLFALILCLRSPTLAGSLPVAFCKCGRCSVRRRHL